MDGRMTDQGRPPIRSGAPATPGNARRIREGIGLPLALLLVWLWFEFGRPPNPMGIPMLLSIAMLGGWLLRKDKRWSRQHSLFVVLLVLLALSVPDGRQYLFGLHDDVRYVGGDLDRLRPDAVGPHVDPKDPGLGLHIRDGLSVRRWVGPVSRRARSVRSGAGARTRTTCRR